MLQKLFPGNTLGKQLRHGAVKFCKQRLGLLLLGHLADEAAFARDSQHPAGAVQFPVGPLNGVWVDSLFDRFFGKATQPTDNKTEHILKPRTLTPEEAREIGVKFFEEY